MNEENEQKLSKAIFTSEDPYEQCVLLRMRITDEYHDTLRFLDRVEQMIINRGILWDAKCKDLKFRFVKIGR